MSTLFRFARLAVTRRRRSGFTLAELLVTMAIMAVLAAVLIPAVAGNIGKSDAARAMNDLTSIRTGLEQFVSDVHRYPSKVSHLTNQVLSTAKDVNLAAYGVGLAGRWKGPYLARDTLGGGLQTGFGAIVLDTLTRVLITAGGTNYVTVLIAGINQTDFNRMDIEMDGTVSATTGNLRWVTGTTVDTVKYLTIPIQ
jgi:prepilin-type N-terminal cleavage/methylation domain-containing protein